MKKLLVTVAMLWTTANSAFAQIGSIDKDLVFTPVTPCRIVDTRTSQGGTGSIAAGATRGFFVWGVTSYAAQGGSATNCGMDASADTAAIAVSMAVLFPAGQGYLTAFPGNIADAAKPLAATMNFNAGEVVVSNAAILKVAQAGSPNLKIFASNSTEVIIDVVGYYSRPVATALECVVTPLSVIGIGPGAGGGTASFCPTGFTRTSNNCEVTAATMPITKNNADGCFVARNTGTTVEQLGASSTCCRVTGR
jgi:hypothetical protein